MAKGFNWPPYLCIWICCSSDKAEMISLITMLVSEPVFIPLTNCQIALLKYNEGFLLAVSSRTSIWGMPTLILLIAFSNSFETSP